MLDGRHTGTGGGNHFVLGGATPLDSPFLRRPDLLRSLISYWHNHPSLSYLFSGLFIGPTSQAPRVDEARHDSVYELELAFSQLPQRDAERAAVARRSRAAPSAGGRDRQHASRRVLHRQAVLAGLGVGPPRPARAARVRDAAARAHEPRAAAAAARARRAVLARAVHDAARPLGHRAARSVHAAVLRLARLRGRRRGVWAAPAIRSTPTGSCRTSSSDFPLAGEVAVRASQLTLRQALEPWPVLGEESSAGGTARYVDSSLERLQVHVTGLTERSLHRDVQRPAGAAAADRPERRVRRRRPLPRLAAAVGLHPTILRHAPLTFDLVDTWMERSLGGCQYHVMHPGGRSYDRFPVNSYEAESRRLARFSRLGHTPGPVRVTRPVRSREFPYTLDLRTVSPMPRAPRPDLRTPNVTPMSEPVRRTTRCSTAYTVPPGHFDELLDADGRRARGGRRSPRTRDLSAAIWRARRRASRGRFTTTASPTTSTRRRTVPAARGRSTSCRFVVPAAEWAALGRGLRQRARLLNAHRRRSLRPAAAAARGPDAAGARVQPPRISPRVPRRLAAGRRVPAPGRVRSGARSRRPLARRQHARAGAVGRRLRAREPHDHPAHVSRGVSRPARAAARRRSSTRFRDAIVDAAPCDERSPHVVLLTPGPYNETYFEHAYLAKHLGFPLVEGADLTVRHDRVFLKTISGLRQVHAILRRLDDDYCDPLELRSDSTLGVPGLVQAWRSGHVLVANAFGTGVLESPALFGLLPAACERLLGEPLEIAERVDTLGRRSLGARRLGRRRGRRHQAGVPGRADGARVPRRSRRRRPPRVGGVGSTRRAGRLRRRGAPAAVARAGLARRPARKPRADAARVSWPPTATAITTLMPGGLSRIAARWTPDRLEPARRQQQGHVGPVRPHAPAAAAHRRAPARAWRVQIDRGRLEPRRRASVLARPLRRARREHRAAAARRALAAQRSVGARQSSQPSFLRACLEPGPARSRPTSARTRRARRRLRRDARADRTARATTCSIARRGAASPSTSIRPSAPPARSAIGCRRTTGACSVSSSTSCQRRRRRPICDDTLALIDRAIVSLVAVGGLEMAHMTRDDGWRFLSVGRHLERLLFVASTLELLAPDESPDHALLEWLLELSDSLITFRARYVSAARLAGRRRAAAVRRAQPAIGALPARENREARAGAAGRGVARRAGRRRRARADVPRRQPARAICSGTCRSTSCWPNCQRAALRPVRRAHAAVLQPRLRAAARDDRAMNDDDG